MKQVILFIMISLFIAVYSVFAVDMKDVAQNGSKFKESAISSLPLSASMGLNWSDAYIGQILSRKPHFGVGMSIGLTPSGADDYKNILKSLGAKEGSEISSMGPLYVAEIRLGGLFLPFDIGLKRGVINELDFENLGNRIENGSNIIYGIDVRAALLKGSTMIPKLSLGIGYNYTGGDFVSGTNDQSYNIGSNILDAKDAEAALLWNIRSIDLKVQASKSFSFVTPYLGLGAAFYWANASYSISSPSFLYSGIPVDEAGITQINTDLGGQGIGDIDIHNDGFSSDTGIKTGVSTMIFGGWSFDLFKFRLNFTAICKFPDFNYSGSLGFRFQL